MADKLEGLIHRLEAAASRIEALSLGSVSAEAKGAGAGKEDIDENSPLVKAFDEILGGHFKNYVDLSQRIGGDVQKQVRISAIAVCM